MKRKLGKVFAGGIAAVCVILCCGVETKAAEKNGVYYENGEWYYYADGRIDAFYNGMAVDEATGQQYWFDYGVLARNKEVYDFSTDTWHWFDADGTMAKNKDVFMAAQSEEGQGKWVRYDEAGNMVKGEEFRYGGWYGFDAVTGAMLKGFVYLPGNETQEGKWVYYDEVTGQMVHGEAFLYDAWYRFDEVSGAMQHGEYCTEDNWYYYNDITGVMQKGEVYRNEYWYYYDEVTGVMQKGEVYHHGNSYYYDPYLGIMRYGLVYFGDKWHLYDEVTGVEQPYNNVVVVIDPGHDSTHSGAYGHGLVEQELNLKIALACKEELEKYKGVTVYLTHDTLDCPFEGCTAKEDLTNRTEYAASVGASLFLSLHNNAGQDISGYEIYYPNDHYDDGQHEAGEAAAECIAQELSSLGLNRLDVVSKDSDAYDDDGTNWYPDGSRADYYNVIRNSKYRGITGLIVEHAYLSNAYDAEYYLSDDAMLEALGRADATGVARYFGLRMD